MKNVIKTLLQLAFVSGVFCCNPIDISDRYELSPQNTPDIVVEAYVTNSAKFNYVKLTKPRSFRSNVSEVIPNAIVTISDNLGSTFTLTYSGDGFYKNTSLLGVADGRIYRLQINYNGKIYTSNSSIPLPLFPIDTIIFEKIEQNQGVPATDVGKYIAKLFTKIRTDVPEYYYFNFYKGDSLINARTLVYTSDNVLLSGSIPGIELPGLFQLGDTAAFEIMSINYDAYKFYSDLNSQLNSDGGLFSAPPANVKGNVTDALGLFKTAYVLSGSKIVE